MGRIKNYFNRIRSPTAKTGTQVQLAATNISSYSNWNRRLYHSDIVRACIRPKAKAIGKMTMHHVYGDKINPQAYMRLLLEEPNAYMTMQVLLEWLSNTADTSGNAYALIVRDENGYPMEIYPIPAVSAKAISEKGVLYLHFTLDGGGLSKVPYTDVIHLRSEFFDSGVFGADPTKTMQSALEIVNAADQSVVTAVKNSSVIRWIMKILQPLRDEDVKKKAENFAKTFLSVDEGGLGVAAVDSKVELEKIEPKDFVPNASVNDRTIKRIYAFFGTNEKIVQSQYTENEWISYYESTVEPFVKQISEEFTRKLFTRRERALGNKIVCEAVSLQYASMTTKLQLIQFVDRGIMTPNEVRTLLSLAPVEGGDVMVRRLDTAPVTEGSSNTEEGGNE